MRSARPAVRLAACAVIVLAGCRQQPQPIATTTVGSTPAASAAGAPTAAPAVPVAGTPPQVIALDPPNGATGVDPARTSLQVSFDREMDPQGWAWVVESPATAPDVGDSTWDAAHRTTTAQVKLAPGRTYVLWVNSPQYPYFRDPHGVSAAPLRWTFTTAGAAAAGTPTDVAVPGEPSPGGAPRVLALDPPNGAVDVDPGTRTLRVSFDRPMAEGWSWVMEEASSFPAMTAPATLSPDGREALLPVELVAGHTYVVWLNSPEYHDFADRRGVSLPPLRWTFSTRSLR